MYILASVTTDDGHHTGAHPGNDCVCSAECSKSFGSTTSGCRNCCGGNTSTLARLLQQLQYKSLMRPTSAHNCTHKNASNRCSDMCTARNLAQKATGRAHTFKKTTVAQCLVRSIAALNAERTSSTVDSAAELQPHHISSNLRVTPERGSAGPLLKRSEGSHLAVEG